MRRSSILGLLLAVGLPLIGYFLVKQYSKDAVHMPRHYFYDSAGTKQVRGKEVQDTLWHKVQGIPFINQYGDSVKLEDAAGKIIVLNFFFSRCPTVCPGLTLNMRKVQQSYLKNPDIVQFISISIDPEYDSVPKLRQFADRFNANLDNWWFVTGNKKQIYDFAFNEIKASIADPGVDTAFIHTENFFLLDSNHVVRGWYNGFDSLKLKQLARDIPTLMLERSGKSPSVFREFIPALPVIFIGLALIFVVMIILNNKKKKYPTR